MDELKSTKLAQPMKQTNNDAAMLRALAADLNNPTLTGAVLTKEQKAENDAILATEFAKAESVENIPQEAQVSAAARSTVVAAPEPIADTAPVQASPVGRPARLFLTGLPGTGIAGLLKGSDAHIFNLRALANDSLKATALLNGNPPANVVTEFRRFGDGEYAPTLQNIFFLGLIRRSFPEFASPAFWVKQVLQALEHAVESDVKQVIVVGLRTSHEFKALLEAGFTHYHAMCSPALAKLREPAGETVSGLAPALESDVQKKISVHKNGPRLNVVWTDTTNAPSTRFWNENDFKKDVVGTAPTVVESEAIQVL